jgi:broad specificity phosphatase PhoE
MTKLILIAAAQTDWRPQGRLAGDTHLVLNEFGHRQAVLTAQEVRGISPKLVRCGPEQATKQTASLVAHEAGVRLRTIKELREINLGVWQGLMIEDLKERFGKVYRQWRADPLSIVPPEGETVSAALTRLIEAVEKIRRKNVNDTVAIVVGQFANAALRCRLVDRSFDKFWDYVDNDQPFRVIDLPDEQITPAL